MTDAISSIADQLLAMINSSPRTPTKAEIEGVLRALPEIMHPMLLVTRNRPYTEAFLTPCDLNMTSFDMAVKMAGCLPDQALLICDIATREIAQTINQQYRCSVFYVDGMLCLQSAWGLLGPERLIVSPVTD